MNPDWRYRLRGDPANWLLDAEDNPSVYFWFQRDIVGRPEESAALRDAREQILYSTPVQEIFAVQNELGYWENPESLDEPRRRSTLWSLALLAELAIPRDSRRARTACEFVFQNHTRHDGKFSLADDQYAGLLVHALVYFCGDDARVKRAVECIVPDAEQGNIFALWALADAPDAAFFPAIERGAQVVLNALARGGYKTFGAFPSFDKFDALLALRALVQLNRASDSRAKGIIEKVWERQGEGARWALEKSYNGSVAARVEEASMPSKWATLNVLRIVTKFNSIKPETP